MRISESKIRQIIREETRRVIAEVDLRKDPEELMQKFRDAQLEIAPKFPHFLGGDRRDKADDAISTSRDIKGLVDMINQKHHNHVYLIMAINRPWEDGRPSTRVWRGSPAALQHKLSINSLVDYMRYLQRAMQARGVEIDFQVDRNQPHLEEYRPAFPGAGSDNTIGPDPLLKIEVVESDNEERDTRNNF